MNRTQITTAALGALALVLAAIGLKLAEHAGIIRTVGGDRTFQVMLGLGLAFYGNVIPKRLGALRGLASASRRQRALRVAGWSFSLAGLAYAGLSIAAPDPIGDALAMGVVAAAMTITLAFAAACARDSARASRD